MMAAFLRRRPAGLPTKVIMKRLSILLAIAATISACGGGGSGGAGASAPAVVVDKRPVVDIVPTVGDFYSYRIGGNVTSGDQPVPSTPDYTAFYTDAISEVGNDRSWVEIETEADRYFSIVEFHYGSDGALTAAKVFGCSSTVTTVGALAPNDLKVGAEWSENHTRVVTGDCATGPESYSESNKALALETITVTAGTFDTIKLVSTHIPVTVLGNTDVREDTLWRDTLTHRLIKAVNRVDRVSSDGSKSRVIFSRELIGYASAKQGRKNLNIERFAGPWAGSYSGTYSGICQGEVSLTGKLDADCGDGLFSVHGDIDVNGKGTFYLTVNGVKGATFSGAFESPSKIGGLWSASAASGTWKLEHQ